jgi:hypothetical protein
MVDTLTLAESLLESSQWDDPPPPDIEEQEFDRLAYYLWRQASRIAPDVEEEPPDVEPVGRHNSCL